MPLSCAKQDTHEHHDHSMMHDDSHHSAMPAAQSYGDAVRQMRALLASMDAKIKAGKYDDVHHDAEALRSLCNSLGELAAARNSPVPRDKVNEVTETAKELSAAGNSFHKAAHAEDLPQVKEHYAHMVKLVDSFARYDGGQ
jgi:hypothetical protein